MDIAVKKNEKSVLNVEWIVKRLTKFLPYLIIILISFVVMLPRISSPQYGLLDDGASLSNVRGITEDPIRAFSFMAGAGRFLPGYWLFLTLLYNLVGAFARKWFIVYFAILAFEGLAIYWLFRLRGFSTWQSCASGALFCISSPVIESFYTFSKAEVLVIGWLLLSLVLFGQSTRASSRPVKIILLVLSPLSMLLAFLSKEIGVVAIGIFASWAIIAHVIPSSQKDFLNRKNSLHLFLLSLVAGLVYFILFASFVPLDLGKGSYTSNYTLDLEVIERQLINWVGFFLRDFLYLVPLLFLLVIPAIRKQGLIKGITENLAWMGAWLIVYLPWGMIQEYFVLPFGVGCAMLGGLLLGRALEVIFLSTASFISKTISSVLLIVSLFFIQLTIPNIITNAHTQLLYDRENFDMVKMVSRLPENANLLVNFPIEVEYTKGIQLHLRVLRGRDDITIIPFRFQGILDEDPLDYYILNPQFINQTLPAVRNSLYEAGVKDWNNTLLSTLNRNDEAIYSKTGDIHLFDFGIHRLLIPLGGTDIMGSVGRPFIDTRTLVYGWEIYHVQIDDTKQFRPGWYTEGGSWLLRTGNGIKKIQPANYPGDIPLTGDINGDGWTDLGLYRQVERSFLFDTDQDGAFDWQQNILLMQPGDVPLLGDWDGDRIDTPSFYRPETSQLFLGDLTSNADVVHPIVFGSGNLMPVVGDWNGDGRDEYGGYDPENGRVVLAMDFLPEPRDFIHYQAEKGMVPAAGDWLGFGIDSLAFIKEGQWCFHPNNNDSNPANKGECMEWETGPGIPFAGLWRQ